MRLQYMKDVKQPYTLATYDKQLLLKVLNLQEDECTNTDFICADEIYEIFYDVILFSRR